MFTSESTSPHLQSIRERIKINSKPISERQFATNYLEIWDKLPKTPTPALDIPRYLQLLALLAFHTFIKAGVSVFICEAHMGGQFDATNVFESPVLSVITTIAEDHVELLGPSIEKIAWHKSGIFKNGRPALSTCQQGPVACMLGSRACEIGATLTFVKEYHHILEETSTELSGPQKENCNLAIEAASLFLQQTSQKELNSQTIRLGTDALHVPGRFQQVTKAGQNWYIDGAHNGQGIWAATRWFLEAIKEDSQSLCVLVFGHYSTRNGSNLLRFLFQSVNTAGQRLEYVVFSSYSEREDGQTRIDYNAARRFSLEKQMEYARLWQSMDDRAIVQCAHTIEGALDEAKRVAATQKGR